LLDGRAGFSPSVALPEGRPAAGVLPLPPTLEPDGMTALCCCCELLLACVGRMGEVECFWRAGPGGVGEGRVLVEFMMWMVVGVAAAGAETSRKKKERRVSCTGRPGEARPCSDCRSAEVQVWREGC
jgi:hypothetical protein